MNTESSGISPENTSGELEENALILFDLLDQNMPRIRHFIIYEIF